MKEFQELSEKLDELKPETQKLKEKLMMEKYEKELKNHMGGDFEAHEKIQDENIEYDHRTMDMM